MKVKVEGYQEATSRDLRVEPKPYDRWIIQDFVLERPEKEFDLKRYDIRFFVTGYYRSNIPEHLQDLRERLKKKPLKDILYIERPGGRYDRLAPRVREIFDTVLTVIMGTILPRFRKYAKTGDYLEIEISGYADPRNISGRYVEDDVSCGDVVVHRNDLMINETLSALRAYYSKVYMDSVLSLHSQDCRKLEAEGKILYICKGKGVDVDSKEPYEGRRRVLIVVWRRTK